MWRASSRPRINDISDTGTLNRKSAGLSVRYSQFAALSRFLDLCWRFNIEI
jgi:hypothetical protein